MNARLISVAVVAAGLLACSGTQKPEAGSLPKGASFHGVWQSPQYGNLHLCQSGNQVVGHYLKNERTGRIQGNVEGDLLEFQWEDHRELVEGKPQIRRGGGYFRIDVGEDGDQYLTGEWGMDDAFSGGGPWNAVKLRRGDPDRCTGAEEPVTLEEEPHPWDEDDATSGGISID